MSPHSSTLSSPAVALPERIIILAGGPSSEAAVSRSTAAGVDQACQQLGVASEVWELFGDWLNRLATLPRTGTFVFLALHGIPGEDGTVQGVLDLLGLPYNGSGVTANALAIDKILTRSLLAQAGLPIAPGLHGAQLTEAGLADFLAVHGKAVAKPATAGSSVGVTIFSTMAEWESAHCTAAAHGPVLIEAFIPGHELTVAALTGQTESRVLPIIEITTPDDRLYDFTSKYTQGGSVHRHAGHLPATMLAALATATQTAIATLGVTGASRTDARYDPATGQFVLLEVNTLPGLTPTSLVPDAAQEAGLSYPELIRWMILDGLQRHPRQPSAQKA